jgi:regulator of protease activity HflC (stomatin/prohibitin superfamily)
VIVIVAVVTMAKLVHVVPTGETHVQLRFDQFHRLVQSGFHVRLPFVDRFVPVSVRPQALTFAVPAITADAVAVRLEGVIDHRISDVATRMFHHAYASASLEAIAASAITHVVAGVELDELRADRDAVMASCRAELGRRFARLGITVDDVVLARLAIDSRVMSALVSERLARHSGEARAARLAVLDGAARTLSPVAVELDRNDALRGRSGGNGTSMVMLPWPPPTGPASGAAGTPAASPNGNGRAAHGGLSGRRPPSGARYSTPSRP